MYILKYESKFKTPELKPIAFLGGCVAQPKGSETPEGSRAEVGDADGDFAEESVGRGRGDSGERRPVR